MLPKTICTILAATDLGADAGDDDVLNGAAALAARSGAELHVVHALEYRPVEPPLPPALQTEIDTAEETLAAHLAEALPAGLDASSREVIVGPAHEVIADRAGDVGADLIVLATHRGKGVRDHVMGTTADRVLRTVDVPCLVIRGPASLPARRIGVTTDFSAASRRALDLVLAWAPQLVDDSAGALDLRVIHHEWSVTLKDDPSREDRVLRPRIVSEIEDALADAGGDVPVDARPVVLSGVNTGNDISDYARGEELQLLAMGTHGEGAVRRALIGSITSSVSRQAPCPVLIVPAADADLG